jgi:hypothetical protein
MSKFHAFRIRLQIVPMEKHSGTIKPILQDSMVVPPLVSLFKVYKATSKTTTTFKKGLIIPLTVTV